MESNHRLQYAGLVSYQCATGALPGTNDQTAVNGLVRHSQFVIFGLQIPVLSRVGWPHESQPGTCIAVN